MRGRGRRRGSRRKAGPARSNSGNVACPATSKSDDGAGPSQKRVCEKLESRLNGMFCCVVCLDTPPVPIFQCKNGHLMCVSCLTHLLADAKFRSGDATCPSCRITITKDNCLRNAIVEKAISELSEACKYCLKEFPRSELDYHESRICIKREVGCRYFVAGCEWRGAYSSSLDHEDNCPQRLKPVSSVITCVENTMREKVSEAFQHTKIFQLLSLEGITFNDLRFKQYHNTEYRIYYETNRFLCFSKVWLLRAFVNENNKDPFQACRRNINYQLVLKSRLESPVTTHYVIVGGPFGFMRARPRLYWYQFNKDQTETPFQILPLVDAAELNKVISDNIIDFRLVMFEIPSE